MRFGGFGGKTSLAVLVRKRVFAVLAKNTFLRFWRKICYSFWAGKRVLQENTFWWKMRFCGFGEKTLFAGKAVLAGKHVFFVGGKMCFWFWWEPRFYGFGGKTSFCSFGGKDVFTNLMGKHIFVVLTEKRITAAFARKHVFTGKCVMRFWRKSVF